MAGSKGGKSRKISEWGTILSNVTNGDKLLEENLSLKTIGESNTTESRRIVWENDMGEIERNCLPRLTF